MSATSEEIISACATLRLSEDAVRQVHSSEAAKELERIAEQFARGTSQRWWWECFDAATSVTFRDQMGFARITRIVPDERAQLWFVVEDDVDPFLLFEGSARTSQSIIGECFGFEYYLIPKDLTWLLCENHHGRLIAVGQPVQDRLRELAAPEGEEVWEVP